MTHGSIYDAYVYIFRRQSNKYLFIYHIVSYYDYDKLYTTFIEVKYIEQLF